MSSSKATRYINELLHRSKDDSFRLKTVEEFVERMGSKIAASYKSASDAFLSETGIDTEKGIVSEDSAIRDGARNPSLQTLADGKRVIDITERYNLGHKGQEAIDAGGIAIPIEQSADDCVYVYVDDILVKHQKECREPDCKRSSKFLENNVACITVWQTQVLDNRHGHERGVPQDYDSTARMQPPGGQTADIHNRWRNQHQGVYSGVLWIPAV